MSKKARVQDYSWGHSLVYPPLASIIDKLDYLKHTLRCRKLKSHPPGGKRGVGSFRGRARLLIYLLRTSGRTCHAEPPYCSPPIPDSSPSFSIPLSELLFPPFPLSFSLPLHSVPSRNTRFQSCGYRQPFELLLQLNIRWIGYPGHTIQ